MMKELSNWGRWGKEDQIGTVNLITAAKRKQAVSLVRDATVVSLSHAQETQKFLDNGQPLIHVMNSTGEGVAGNGAAMDTYTMTYHGGYYTHMDALCHMFYEGRTYNGYPQKIVTGSGASRFDIVAFKEGIVTRGILMDIPRLRGFATSNRERPFIPKILMRGRSRRILKSQAATCCSSVLGAGHVAPKRVPDQSLIVRPVSMPPALAGSSNVTSLSLQATRSVMSSHLEWRSCPIRFTN